MLTIKTMKLPMRDVFLHMLLVSVLATVGEVFLLILCPFYFLIVLISHFVEVPLVLYLILSGPKRLRRKEIYKRGLILIYLYLILINGVVEGLWNLIGSGWRYPILVFASTVLTVMVISFLLEKQRMKKGIYPVDIVRSEIVWTAKGFYDTGNGLLDPYTGRGVHIISRNLAKRLELDRENGVTIPFSSLGQENGLLLAYYVEKITVYGEGKEAEIEMVPFAIGEDALFRGKGYEMILNENLW